METKDNVHEGHRARMMDKVINYPDSLYEHEKLEALLFFALPRINTNPLAHRLIKTFGSLDRVLCASVGELKTVEGVGDRVAGLIKLVGEIIKGKEENKNPLLDLSTPDKCARYVLQLFDGNDGKEQFYLLLLDNNSKLVNKVAFSDSNADKVKADIPEISNALHIHRPRFAIMVHNHPSGIAFPSEADDFATMKINLICTISGTDLRDHIIYGKGNVYSYRLEQRIEGIKERADVNKVLNSI